MAVLGSFRCEQKLRQVNVRAYVRGGYREGSTKKPFSLNRFSVAGRARPRAD
jgi:hypothetical protein